MRSLQSRVLVLLCRHSGCRAGQRDALRDPDAGEQSNVTGNLNVAPWRQFVRALGDTRARGKRCVPLARHGTAQPARARFG